jgi:hypothetical protein
MPLGFCPRISQQFARHRLLGFCRYRSLAQLERFVPHPTSLAHAQCGVASTECYPTARAAAVQSPPVFVCRRKRLDGRCLVAFVALGLRPPEETARDTTSYFAVLIDSSQQRKPLERCCP